MPSIQVYGSVASLKLRIVITRPASDVWLLQILTAASRSIDRACNRATDGFLTVLPYTKRIYAGSGMPIQRIDECTSIELVEVKDSITDTTYISWAATDWILYRGDQRSPQFNEPPFDQLMVELSGNYALFTSGAMGGGARLNFNPRAAHGLPTVRVEGLWGYANTTPPEIEEAAMMQAARWYKRYQGSMSDSLADGELGMLLYRKALDPDIRRILVDGRYIKRMVS